MGWFSFAVECSVSKLLKMQYATFTVEPELNFSMNLPAVSNLAMDFSIINQIKSCSLGKRCSDVYKFTRIAYST